MRPINLPSSDTKYVKSLASFTLIAVVILMLANIVVSAQVSYWGYELGLAQTKSQHITEANRLLKQDIVRQTSLSKYMSHARSLGFTSGVALLRLPVSQPVAMISASEP